MAFWMQKEDPEYFDDDSDSEWEQDDSNVLTDDLPQFVYDPYNTVNS